MTPPKPRTKKKTEKPKSRPKPAKHNKDEIGVRMYNVGFGDAFLLKIPSKSKTLKVLVDCGSHAAGPGPRPIREVASQIVRDVTENGKAHIDVVIATHRHQDHVSGFGNDAWDEVEVGEVWMPWTEDPVDPRARKIRETQSKVATHLVAQMTALGMAPELRELAGNSLTNAAAMRTLHEGFSGNPKRRFLPKEEGPRSFAPKCLPGVVVHVLGPSRDAEVIRDMDPPAGQSYLRMRELGASTSTEVALVPFRTHWVENVGDFLVENPNLALRPKEIEILSKIGSGEELAVAVALDKAVNGTSLLLMFQVKKAHLLLSGDAQWGSWHLALEDPQWRELLTKTTFHKVGHHGSHNASPKEFVDNVLGDGVCEMVSTRPMKKWKYIPKEELLTELRKKERTLVRSDKADPKESPQFLRHLGEDAEKGGLWIDTTIPV
jgi:beta-lactamase superfamily II metal-dependent hydrolase